MHNAHATDYALRSLSQIDAAAIARRALGERVLAVEAHDPRAVALSRDPDGVALVLFEDGPACALFVEFETDARAELAKRMAVTTMLLHGKVGHPVRGVALLVLFDEEAIMESSTWQHIERRGYLRGIEMGIQQAQGLAHRQLVSALAQARFGNALEGLVADMPEELLPRANIALATATDAASARVALEALRGND